ncbi:MAG: type IV pilus secretin PilQ [Gammaproteobacteria bacterium]|nr:type IV pilus secretin PilQ [Gammaproteobacteria bacterium]NIR82225.1 type IV pilus secretin PilQ [Gammaproteobacteria bacterium]NIR90824.1 type IV pilus secretin PilQ [Gammaproteobacteria bacterium]NIU03375.1 type IV pilus secretin PilQ [Gammaproteobacteria bacterium]NIV50871.1 type IV pilus secretin PilQ [Gammaproteobacteria bacterium]
MTTIDPFLRRLLWAAAAPADDGRRRTAGPRFAALCVALALLAWAPVGFGQSELTLDAIGYSSLPGDRVRIELELSGPVQEPLVFAVEDPPRVAIDFTNVGLNLERKSQTVGIGMARSVTAVEAGGRTRVVLNLVRLVPYELQVRDSVVLVTLESSAVAAAPAVQARATAMEGTAAPQERIENVDFRRGESGEGRVLVTLSDPSIVVDMRQEGTDIVVDFVGATLPERLERRLDVMDFATPVKTVDTFAQGDNVRMVISASGRFEHLAYQSGDLLTVDVKPVTEEEAEARKKEFTGERLSLNFQDIEVRAVLQVLAEFTGLNIVASDSVSGNLTLRLKNVPWDQALDIILKSKGLAKRQTGNVIMVAPAEELAARERLELEAQQQVDELAPLQTEFVQVNYAKASDIATLLKAEQNTLMSERGNVTVDERTNTLLVRDTAENLVDIRQLVTRLDVPVRQVLIESRIVIADDKFTRQLGVRFGYSRTEEGPGDYDFYSIGGGRAGDTEFGVDTDGDGIPDQGIITGFGQDDVENLIVDLPTPDPSGALKFAIGTIGNKLLQLELDALQTEGRGEVLSNPRVITSNQKEAVIEQGTEIPFQEASSSGATSTSFKKAVLSLRVTPQITPDDRIIMDLQVTKDSVGATFGGIPSIDTQAVTTQVLVDNGETVVLGGIFEQTLREDIEKVPFFGDLPFFGRLFRNTRKRDDKNELLIFVTPKVIKEALAVR